jgi:starch-binding outer membrane protein, SusD/RagB family
VEQGLVYQAAADAFIAELKVLRAFYYYWLLDLYGQVPIVTQFADADPTPPQHEAGGLRFRGASELSENVPKLSQTVDGSTYGRMNYWAGKAIQAKLYLNAGLHRHPPLGEAIAACDEIINSGKFSLEANFFINFNLNSEVSKEIIFAIPFDKVFAQGFVLPMRTLHYGSQDTYNLTAQPWNGFCSLRNFTTPLKMGMPVRGDPGTTLTGPAQNRGSFLAGFQYKSNGEPVVDSGAEPADDLMVLNSISRRRSAR